MPRPEAFDEDDGGSAVMALPDRFSNDIDTGSTKNDPFNDSYSNEQMQLQQQQQQMQQQEEDPELMELERRLNEEVDEDFFEEPRQFNTLQRVIDVLGLQMIDDATMHSEHSDIAENPAYCNLKGQQRIVEGAIEHMAVIHCADLNGSVIQVGRVARQFSEAVSKVRNLRKQVRDIQDTLGANATQNSSNNNNNNSNGINQKAAVAAAAQARSQNAAAMSLRELWLKKLECEASLSLLEKLDVIRAAPARFDAFIRPPCRIGAAVLTVSQALQTMFSDDVAQVQALHKIMEQLMLRKQRSEEIIWDTLHDVLYLRTGNGLAVPEDVGRKTSAARDAGAAASASKGVPSSAHSVSSESRRSGRGGYNNRSSNVATTTAYPGAMVNPFSGSHVRFAVDEDLDDQSVDSADSGASLFSLEDGDDDSASGKGPGGQRKAKASSSAASVSSYDVTAPKRMMIPIPMLEAELDLEADERRCLEEIALSGLPLSQQNGGGTMRQRQLPRYADPVLALRILVECLAHLKRLDDVERILSEGLEREIRQIVQREQARTFSRLEKNRVPQSIRSLGRAENMKDFRRHLTGLLSAFGCVMVRLSHLAEILRLRISSDKELLQKIESPSSVMRAVLSAAYEIMQRELKLFLKACLHDADPGQSDPMDTSMRKGSSAHESGLFSLGIVDSSARNGGQKVSTATRSNVMEMSATKFVSTVLFPKTKVEPQVRHALTFRRSVARWTTENEALKKELATLTGEDTSAPSYNISPDESAIQFLDGVIQKDLLPVLQEEAVNGTVKGLERRDAFDPVFGRSLYARPNSNEAQDVDVCIACQAMYQFTGPLFSALHRLPPGGEMYLPLVAVLEHVMLTFISRVKQQMGKLCNTKTAYTVLKADSKRGSFSTIMERRKPFSQLLGAYADGDALESAPAGDDPVKQSGMAPLTPPTTDTEPHRPIDLTEESPVEDLADGVEGEEMIFDQELRFLRQYVDFTPEGKSSSIVVCSDEDMMKASCLAHSLLKLASQLEGRLKTKGHDGFSRTLISTRALREAIKSIKLSGVNMAKFCRLDMLMQTVSRLSKICKSSTIVARDAVRIPSSVNDLGEYLTGASDNLREAAGNAVTAYTFSSLEQYIPLSLMQTVRVVAGGKGIVAKSPLTMNGIEALDRSGSVLYRDLKGATSFDNSFWDVELAAMSFERSASFMAMLELEMEELCAYYSANRDDFSKEDFELMFSMTGPRRRGDVGRLHMMERR